MLKFKCSGTLRNLYHTLYFKESPITVCFEVVQACSKVGVAWKWSPTDEILSGLSVGATSLFVPGTFKFKFLIT